MKTYDFIVVGGGASGFFAAINFKLLHPEASCLIVEANNKVLSKVKISGGGRCNVTHACFIPSDLVKYYPRGEKELRSVFSRFQPGDTMEWFESRGVALKIEDDGRIFPVSDSSQTIIDCFTSEIEKNNIEVRLSTKVQDISNENDVWKLTTQDDINYNAKNILIAVGGNTKLLDTIYDLGINIIDLVPSLFTFNTNHSLFSEFPGLSVPEATVKINGTKLEGYGPLLVTHWGLSGPAILKMSAWGARELFDLDYKFDISINWLSIDKKEIVETLKSFRTTSSKQLIKNKRLQEVPKRLWGSLISSLGLNEMKWADISNDFINQIAETLTNTQAKVTGKSTFKDEFVTAGGVDLKEINFKTMESKKHKGLYFAGEVLNIDAITGGFNFQNAWSTGWVVANSVNLR